MPAERVCSECSAGLGVNASPVRKTCSMACRAKRQRRQQRTRRAVSMAGVEARHPAHHTTLSTIKKKELASEVMAEELRPVVREAITEDVLRSIQGLVGLTGRAVELIAADMNGSDPVLAQKAATLVLRYTMGNQSVAPAPTAVEPAGMTVNFHVPRPTEPVVEADLVVEEAIEAGEARICAECGITKATDAFVAGSSRCHACNDGFQAKIAERFGS